MATLPFDKAFREQIVRLLFQDPDFASGLVDYLDPEFFDERHLRWVVRKIMWTLKTKNTAATLLIINNEAQKDVKAGLIKDVEIRLYAKFIASLKKPVPDRTYVAEEVHSFCKQQMWKKLALQAAEELIPRGRFEELGKLAVAAAQEDFTGNQSLGHFYGEGAEGRQAEREARPKNGITTGLKLDSYTNTGGPPPKSLAIVAAPPGRGKTNFLLNAMLAGVLDMPEPEPAVYYSLEMRTEMLTDRLDSRVSGIPLRVLPASTDEFTEKWGADLGKRLRGLINVREYPTGQATVTTIRQHLKALERVAFYPRSLYIDYAELMKPSVTTSDANENMYQVFVDLRGLAMEKNLLIWTAAQGNRGSIDPENGDSMNMSQLAGTIKKFNIADFFILLHQTMQEREDKIMRATIEKNRFGPTGAEIMLKADHDVFLLKDMPTPPKAVPPTVRKKKAS